MSRFFFKRRFEFHRRLARPKQPLFGEEAGAEHVYVMEPARAFAVCLLLSATAS